MSVYLDLKVSKATAEKEWVAVYEESLQLARAFHLGETREVSIHGIEVVCLVPTEEREMHIGWRGEIVRRGWQADGDLDSLATAESFVLDREFPEGGFDPDAGDPIASELYDAWADERKDQFNKYWEFWGMKTQGEPYHMYLLAIACLIESRLGNKAYLSGDITLGQCRAAVGLANEHLEHPIEVPARCDMRRLWRRVDRLSVGEHDKLRLCIDAYLGAKDLELGEFLRKVFSRDAIEAYWGDRLGSSTLDSIGYRQVYKEFLELGFDLGMVVRLTASGGSFSEEDCETLVKVVLSSKLHVEHKDCSDVLRIDPNSSQRYGVATQFASIIFGMFGGLGNDSVNRYIPLDEIRSAFQTTLGVEHDTNKMIDEYLAKEEDRRRQIESEDMTRGSEGPDPGEAKEIFQASVNRKVEGLREAHAAYDVVSGVDFIHYRKGYSVEPAVERAIEKLFVFYCETLEEERYIGLMGCSARERCKFLADQNRSILISENDWGRIFERIEADDSAFARYYPFVRLRISSEDVRCIVTALITNDDFYEYASGLHARA